MTRVHSSGPIFDGRAEIISKEMTDNIAKEVAQEGFTMVRGDLAQVIRTHPTGRYIPSVRTIKKGRGEYEVGTRIIYGPWIEGTGSRNRTTRFKGYSSFRRTAQALQQKAVPIALRVMPPYIGRMN